MAGFGVRLQAMAGVLAALALVPALAAQDFIAQRFNAINFSAVHDAAVDDTGIYAAGNGFGLVKFAFDGPILWTKVIEQDVSTRSRIAAGGAQVYVLANRGGFYGDISLRAFGADGQGLWIKTVNHARELAADEAGVYVVGGDESGFVRRYDRNGGEVWSVETLGRVEGVAVDSTGVYWGGLSGVGQARMLQKLRADGALAWSRALNDDSIAKLTLDGAGLYAVRRSSVVEKFDLDGNLSWSRDLDAGISDIEANGTGLYVVGSTKLALPGSCRASFSDIYVTKLDDTGETVWGRQFGNAHAEGGGVALHGSGVYVAGHSGGRIVGGIMVKLDQVQPAPADSGPWIYSGCVVNAAAYRGSRLAPREIISIFGRGMGPQLGATASLQGGAPLPSSLGGARVLINGSEASLLYVSSEQINAVAPDEMPYNAAVTVEVDYLGNRSNAVTTLGWPAHPGLFTLDASGAGPVLALNEDGTVNGPENQAEIGSSIRFFVTGLGLTATKPSVYFCCYSDQVSDAEIESLKQLPIPGLYEVQIRIPSVWIDQVWGSPAGKSPMTIAVGDDDAGLANYIYIRGSYH